MSKKQDLSEFPQWFIDLFLSSYSAAKEQEDRAKSAGIFLDRERTSEGDILKGCSFIWESGKFIFLGRRESNRDEKKIEHITYETKLNYGEEQET